MNTDNREFYWINKAYYADSVGLETDEIMFGLYGDDGGTSGEMAMRWKWLGGNYVPQLQVFDDAWGVLNTFGDLLNSMAACDNESIAPHQFYDMLVSHGFKDTTEYSRE